MTTSFRKQSMRLKS